MGTIGEPCKIKEDRLIIFFLFFKPHDLLSSSVTMKIIPKNVALQQDYENTNQNYQKSYILSYVIMNSKVIFF